MAVLNSWQRVDRVLSGRPFGDGADGNATISSDPNIRATFTGTATQYTGTAGSTAFSNGDLVMLIQSQFTGTGQWEINMVVSGGGTTSLTFKEQLHYSYVTGAQIIKIPRYDELTVNSFTVTAWNGSTGGVVYLLARKILGSGTINLDGGHANNVARATGGGYRGGTYIASTAANAQAKAGEGSQGDLISQQTTTTPGGGGARRGASSSTSAGGGGGGNGGTGNAGAGEANTIPGAGGNSVGSADLTSMFFGGGGGGRLIDSGGPWGQGASGGGILVFNTKDSSSWSGNVYSRGGNANSDGGGGGGGGSILYILGAGSIGSSVLATGGTQPPSGSFRGGGGGTGRIAVHHSGIVTGTSNPTFTDIEDSTLVEITPSEILSEIHGVQDIYSEIKSEITGIRDSSEILSEVHGVEDVVSEIQSQISGAEYKPIKGGYRILIKDRSDNFLGEIDNFRRLEFGKRHNNYGVCQFEMPVNDDKADLIELRKNKIEIYWQENGDMTRVWAGELADRTGKLDNAGNNWDVISGFTWLEQLNSRHTRAEQLYRDEDQGDILWDLIYSTQFPYVAFNKFYPTGNGTDSENMPVVGVSSAYLAVNTLNDDTYIANEEDGNYISLFTTDFSFIPVGATINSVKVYARIETLTVDYGDNEIAILVDSKYHGSGDLGISNNQPFTTYSYTWTQNPETSLDWEVSDLVGFEFGVNLSFARCSLIYVEVDFETTDSDKFDFGFTKGNIEVTTNRDRTYNNQNIMEAFINMSNVISGCDFEITDDKVLNVYLIKGQDKTQDIILEYGENVSDVQIDENFVHPVNKAIVLGQSTEVTDSLLRVERNDTNLQDEYKVREGLMSEMDVSETSTLQEKGDALIRKQGEPLVKLDLTMVKGSEVNPTMFDLGDLVRVVIKDGHYNIDEEFRIYEWNVGFDDNDASQLSLVLGKFIVDIS